MTRTRLAVVVALATAAATPAWAAGEAVVIVEEATGLEQPKRLDLLAAGSAIELGTSGRVVLGYLKSCWQERIAGGRLVVDELRSRVEGAAVTRRLVDCDKAGQGEAPVARGLVAEPSKADLPKPDLVIFGRSPVVLLAAGTALTVERLDQPAKVDVKASADRMDFADLGIVLVAEGLYRFRAGEVSRIVRVDGFAEPGASPVVGRLVILR